MKLKVGALSAFPPPPHKVSPLLSLAPPHEPGERCQPQALSDAVGSRPSVHTAAFLQV